MGAKGSSCSWRRCAASHVASSAGGAIEAPGRVATASSMRAAMSCQSRQVQKFCSWSVPSSQKYCGPPGRARTVSAV